MRPPARPESEHNSNNHVTPLRHDGSVDSDTHIRLDLANDRLRTLCGHVNALHAELVELAVELIELRELGAWVPEGLHTVELYLGWRAGVSPATARRIVAVAERAHEFPTVMGAFAAGELTLDQVAVAVSPRVPSSADASICRHATQLTVTQLRKVVHNYDFGIDDEASGGARATTGTDDSAAGGNTARRAVNAARRAGSPVLHTPMPRIRTSARDSMPSRRTARPRPTTTVPTLVRPTIPGPASGRRSTRDGSGSAGTTSGDSRCS